VIREFKRDAGRYDALLFPHCRVIRDRREGKRDQASAASGCDYANRKQRPVRSSSVF